MAQISMPGENTFPFETFTALRHITDEHHVERVHLHVRLEVVHRPATKVADLARKRLRGGMSRRVPQEIRLPVELPAALRHLADEPLPVVPVRVDRHVRAEVIFPAAPITALVARERRYLRVHLPVSTELPLRLEPPAARGRVAREQSAAVDERVDFHVDLQPVLPLAPITALLARKRLDVGVHRYVPAEIALYFKTLAALWHIADE